MALLTVNLIVSCLKDKSFKLRWPEDEFRFKSPKLQIQAYRFSAPVTPHAFYHWSPLKRQSPLISPSSVRHSVSTRTDFFTARWHQDGGFKVKVLQWSQECGKPPPMWSNHSCLSIILAPPPPPSNLSPPCHPFHYSHLTSQRIRVTLHGTPPPLLTSLSLPASTSSPSISHPLLPVHCSVYGGWHRANSISRPRQPPQPPLQRGVTLFSTLHTSSSLLLLHTTFYFLICHSCFPFTRLFSAYLWLLRSCPREGVFKMALLCWGSDMFHCAAVAVWKVAVGKS